jgi:non-specific protein-tyrosine kinase
MADFVLLDTPPLVPVTDAVVLSSQVDGVVLVVEAGKTRRRHLARSVEFLSQADAPVLGAVLNGAGRHARYGYYERYGYYKGGRRMSNRKIRKERKARAHQMVTDGLVSENGNGQNGSGVRPVSSGFEQSPEP